jgi:hypothetical protein
MRYAPDTFLTLAQLGQHATAIRQQAQLITTAILLRQTAAPAIEAQIAELEHDCGALCAALRAELGRRRAAGELREREHAA